MEQTTTNFAKPKYDCRTLRVDECASILGIGRSAAYSLVRDAEATNGTPFKVLRLGNTILVSAKSFFEFLDSNGL